MKRQITASVLVTASLLTPALAFLPVGTPVYDAASDANQTIEISKMVSELSQLAAMYSRLTDQLVQMQTNARFLTTLGAYRQAVTPWQGMSTTNTYGNTSAWINAVNSGLNTLSAWNTASLPRVAYGAILANIPAGQAPRVQSHFATLELQDGTASAAMQTLGGIRLHGAQNDSTLANLENDSLSSAPNLNTELAVLNKINAAGMINARQAGDTNKLLASVSEAQVVDLKAKSDMVASAIAQDVAFRNNAGTVMSSQHAGYSNAMLAYRLP